MKINKTISEPNSTWFQFQSLNIPSETRNEFVAIFVMWKEMNAVWWTFELKITWIGAAIALAAFRIEPLTSWTCVRYWTTIDAYEEMFTAGFVR